MAFDSENINVQLVDLVVVYDFFQHWWTTFKTITGKSIFTKKSSTNDDAAIVCKLSGTSMSVWIEFQDRDLFFKVGRVLVGVLFGLIC